MTTNGVARSLALFVFGVIVPTALLFQAYSGLNTLGDRVSRSVTDTSAAQTFSTARQSLHDANDYALYSVIAAERTNQLVVTNKQIMKISVMQIGFAVASLGIMFVVLGFSDGGAQGSMDAAGFKFDFKTGSTGAVVFVIGAAMATAGGVMRNDYQTVPIPGYIDGGDGDARQAHAAATGIFKECAKQPQPTRYECFYKFFEKQFKADIQ
jgi:hypothetical protein